MPNAEDELLRSVALQNAQSILHARQRAEEELLRTQEALQMQSESLRRNEQQLSDFFENAPIGLLWVGRAGIIERVNRSELEMLGYSREEFVGRHIAEFHADRQVIDDILNRLQAGEELRDCPARMRCKNGSIKQVLITANVLRKEGRFLHTCCFMQDVTERKLMEEAQSRLAAIVESSDDAIVSKDLSGRILSWNVAAERLFGYTEHEAVGQPITVIIPPERQHEEIMILERIRRGERIDHYETVRISKQGRRIDVSVTISPVRDAAGQIIGASKIARDVTARRHAEQTTRFLADASVALSELTDYESTLQKVVSLAVPFFADWGVVDLLESDGSVRRLAIIHADPEKVRLVQTRDRDFPIPNSDARGVGKVIYSGRSEWAAEIADGLPANSPHAAEYVRMVRSLRLKSFLCVPLKSPTGVRGALTFVTAESGRTYHLEDLRAAEDLAHRAVIAIENASLLSALQDSDRRKDELLAILAHELRNPLAPIANALQVIRTQGPAITELECARDIIGRQVEQMTRLVDDLLDASRVSRGTITLRKEQVELSTLVGAAVEASRPLIDKRGHRLIVEIPREPILLDVDPTRLSQVLLNLLNNSAKYMDPGGRIWLTAVREGNEASIRVKDAGIGISKEMLPRIFEMFMQVDRTLERSQGGLGIGLTLVRRLVELHDGSIEVKSDGPGLGSEFTVRLPLAEVQSPTRSKPANLQVGRRTQDRRRLLIVDDNQDSAKSLAMLLQLMGHDVRTAFDGLEAVAAAAEFQPEVVLMDIGLPKLNGFEAGARIREEHGSRVMLVALTGWGQEDDRRRSKEAGFDYHLTKPVDIKSLMALLADRRSPCSSTSPDSTN